MIACGKCGRPLTDPDSVDLGIGPICRMRAKRQVGDRCDLFGGPDFEYYLFDDAVVILDLNVGGQSVTNGIRSVIEQIHRREPALMVGRPVIYQDSSGIFDGVTVQDGKFQDFYSIGSLEVDAAIDKAKGRCRDA